MKPVLLSADSEIFAYMVPDEVADYLIDYCEDFLDWIGRIFLRSIRRVRDIIFKRSLL